MLIQLFFQCNPACKWASSSFLSLFSTQITFIGQVIEWEKFSRNYIEKYMYIINHKALHNTLDLKFFA